jgi:opacity protein-like surface antigen
MKRLALLGLFSVAVMANENGLYLGAEVGSTHIEATDTGNIDAKSNSASLAVNGGYYINQNSRAYVAYQSISKGDFAARTKVYSAGYDYLFGTSSMKPFVGAILAYSTFKNGDFEPKGMAYGAQVGVDYKLNNNLSVDAGYRYLSSNAEATYYGEKATMDNFQTLFIGANYKF